MSALTATYLPFTYPGSGKWHEQRRQGIGGSEVSTILGLNQWESALDLWRLKVGEAEPTEREQSEPMKWGNLLEPLVCDELEAHLQDNVDPGLYLRVPEATMRHHEHEWMLANVDRLVFHDTDSTPCAVAEVKTVGLNGSGEWAEPDEIAQHALLQGVHYMAVTGLPRCYFGVLIAGQQFRWRVLERDESLEATVVAAEEEFWDHVQRRVPPLVSAHDRFPANTTAALNRMWRDIDADSAVELGPEYQQYLLDYKRLDAGIKSITTNRDALGNLLREALGDKEIGTVDGEVAVTWKVSTRNAIDQKALKDEQPEIADKYTKTSTTRRLLVK